jgi:hypothetical protein
MSKGNRNVYVYLLIDNGMLHEASASYTEAGPESRPPWLVPIYAERALAVSPFLVDVEAAYEAGDLDRVMDYVNARTPALHVSIIETGLDPGQLAHHLGQFIFIVDPQGKQFTLRYADCTVLTSLSSLLTPVQWATMRGPIARWKIHDRSGAIIPLPPAEVTATAPTPIRLDQDQLIALDEASEPDHYIAKVKMMRNGAALPGNAMEQHQCAQAARQAWRAADNPSPLILLFLTEAALVTRGEVLRWDEIPKFLVMNEVSAFRSKLRELVDKIQERKKRARQVAAEAEKCNVDAIFI